MNKIFKCAIVDDDPVEIAILNSLISRIDYLDIIGEFENSAEAPLHINTLKPDIVFMDLNMPALDGTDIMELLKHKTKFIIISAEKEQDADLTGIDYCDFIRKPITSFSRFEAAITKAIEELENKEKTH